jgi:murein tripeptide amidase MpaA
MMMANPDFQMEEGYPIDAPGTADLSICSNYIANTFNCPAITLEMPFKDTADTPMPLQGWSPERASKLGGSALDGLFVVVEEI